MVDEITQYFTQKEQREKLIEEMQFKNFANQIGARLNSPN
jgi:hypothetical protein